MKCLFICLTLALFLSGCGGGVTKMGIGDVHDFRVERIGLGWAEATVVMDVYNGNKKNITFDNANIELISDDRMLAVATLRGSVEARSGTRQVEVPVRIRFKLDGVGEIIGLFLPKQQTERGQKLRMKGSFDISRGGKVKSLQFNRKLSDKAMESVGEQYGKLFDFNR